MKQAITFNGTTEALIPKKRPLAPGYQKKDNDHTTFLPQASPGIVHSMVSKQL